MTEPYASAEVVIKIPFHDVDMMHVAWHGHYAKYLELARNELFNSIAYNVPEMEASGYAWPIIDLRIRYAHPLRFEQKIRVRASVIEIENRLRINYEVYDFESGKRLTRAYTSQVALRISSGQMLFASPRILYEKLGL